MPNTVFGLDKYKEERDNRVVFKKISPVEAAEGLEKTLFLSSATFGYAYTDEKTLEQLVDIANQDDVEKVVMSGGVYGEFLLVENRRRRLMDHEYPNLDAQLRRFKNWRDSVNADFVYLMGENDDKIIENLHALYVKEHERLKESEDKKERKKKLFFYHHQRTQFNAEYDEAEKVIHDWLYPYMLRAGYDPTHLHEGIARDEEDPPILKYMNVFTRVKRMRDEGESISLRDAEKKIVQPEFFRNTDKFSVERSGVHKKKHGEVNVEVQNNLQFSAITQYANPHRGMDELAKLIGNGTVQSDSNFLVDLRTGYGLFRVDAGGIAQLAVPYAQDDRRYFDSEFSNRLFKRTLADPVHKRATIPYAPNLPGAMIISGDQKEGRVILQPFMPKILESMEEVQKTGKSKRYVKVYVGHDMQLNSITERLDMFVKTMDYAFTDHGPHPSQKSATAALLIGDHIHGRNYPDLPNENAYLGGLMVDGQKKMFVNLVRPFLMNKKNPLEYVGVVPGNHEWNSDFRAQAGTLHCEALQTAMEQFQIDNGLDEKLRLDFPTFAMTADGDIMKAPWGYVDVNGYNILFSHMFHAKMMGAKGGSGSNPSKQQANWFRKMGTLAKEYDIGCMGHLHQMEVAVHDNRLNCVLGAYAGESGFEYSRAYASYPMTAILHFRDDGGMHVEILSENYLKDYQIQNPGIRALADDPQEAVDKFIVNASTEPIYKLGSNVQERDIQKMHRREMEPKDSFKIE